MPWIIDYQTVLDRMRAKGFKCLYYNSGAFGFADPAAAQSVGWVGRPDSTIRPAALALAREIPEPFEPNLAKLASLLWRKHAPGRAWVMPMSHWAYELSHGSAEWLPALIENIELDPGLLEGRNNAAAIEFAPDETQSFEHFVERLLEMLQASDFALTFPGHQVVCSIHHHGQLWWTTDNPPLLEILRSLPSTLADKS